MPEVTGGATVVAPGAGAAVLTIAAASIPAGTYRVQVSAYVSNNAVADVGNMKLQRGGVDLVNPLPHGVNGQAIQNQYDEVAFDGSQNLTVNAIGAGTAAIEYFASVELYRTA